MSTLPKGNRVPRLAIVVSHPIQYHSPWFRDLAATGAVELKVFYLWDFGVEPRFDRQFGRPIQWDIPLLDGYEHEFVANRSPDPGTHHFDGLRNPDLVERLQDWRPDAILLFGYLFRSHFGVMFSRRLRGIPMLLRGDSHELFRPPGPRSVLKRWGRSALFRRFDAFLAVGAANAEYFRRARVPESKIHFAPHCVDNERFQGAAPEAIREAGEWRRQMGISENSPVVLFAGKFEDKKRPLDLVKAFGVALERLRQDAGPQASLLLVGSGDLEGRLRAAAGDHLNRAVFMAPFQNQSRMPRVYAACDVFALPSYGSGETWGLAVNEAMNLGKPAIVSSHVGCGPDLVIPGETGWIFPAGDIDALADALVQTIAMDGPLREKMGAEARRRVSAYSYDAATAGLLRATSALVAHWRET